MKKLFLLLGGILLISVIIIVVIILKKKKKKGDCENEYDDENNCNEEEESEYNDETRISILKKYLYSKKNNKIITLSDEVISSLNITGKVDKNYSNISNNEEYNIRVYIYNNDSNYYYAYAFIENQSGDGLNNEKINTDFMSNNNFKTNIPFVNFSFSKEGKIEKKLFNENIDSIAYLNILIDFLENISFKEDLKNNVLKAKKKFNKNNESKEIYIEKENPFLNNMTSISTKENITLNENGDIIHLYKEEKFPLNFRNLTTNDNEYDEYTIQVNNNQGEDNIRKGIIEKYEVSINTEMKLKESNKPDNGIINSIKEFTKNIKFIEYDSINKKLNKKENNININENNEPQFRNLEVASFFNPIQFSYSLFKLNLFTGDAIGLGASVGFFPMNNTVIIQLIFKQNEKSTPIVQFKDNEYDYYSLANKIEEIYMKVYLTINDITFKIKGNVTTMR